MVIIRDLVGMICNESLEVNAELIGKSREGDQDKILNYFNHGIIWSATASLKRCEFCDAIAGPITYLIDGAWLWPKFIHHYIEVHGLQLPQAFLLHIRNLGYEVPIAEAMRVMELPPSEMMWEQQEW
jgi:hypothetical protein